MENAKGWTNKLLLELKAIKKKGGGGGKALCKSGTKNAMGFKKTKRDQGKGQTKKRGGPGKR